MSFLKTNLVQKIILILLAVSLIFLTLISINAKHFLALYYVVWIGGVGSLVWRYRLQLEEVLLSWSIGGFTKFLFLGIVMILAEETLAGISMHLAISRDLHYLLKGILQFWAFNILALPGFIIAWYILLSKFKYTRKEVFILVGLFGLFAESIGLKILGNPIAGMTLVLPTMFTYAIIVAPSVMSFNNSKEGKLLSVFPRYVLGFILPIIASLPFIGILAILKNHFPDVFPPAGFVG